MVTEKSYNLSEKRVGLPWEKGSGTSWASFDGHLPKKYLQKRLKLATFPQWAKGSRKEVSEGPTVLLAIIHLVNTTTQEF